MKLNTKDLIGTAVSDPNGTKLGKVKDLLFDDAQWTIRYAVVDTGSWLSERCVLVMPHTLLITPHALNDGEIPCTLTKEAIEDCPPLDKDAPVSRRYEIEYASYYKESPYWLGSVAWGIGDSANLMPPTPEEQAAHDQALQEIEACHVRSTSEVEGYHVLAANDVDLGEVEQFDIDWDTKRLLNIVTKEGGLLQSTQERNIAPASVARIDWGKRSVRLTVPVAEVTV